MADEGHGAPVGHPVDGGVAVVPGHVDRLIDWTIAARDALHTSKGRRQASGHVARWALHGRLGRGLLPALDGVVNIIQAARTPTHLDMIRDLAAVAVFTAHATSRFFALQAGTG